MIWPLRRAALSITVVELWAQQDPHEPWFFCGARKHASTQARKHAVSLL